MAKALAALSAQPDTNRWRPGFFALPPALGTHVVVVRLLPRTRETLLLRLMGRGVTQRQAMEDLRALEPDTVTRALFELIDCWRVVVIQTPEPERDKIAQELLMNAEVLKLVRQQHAQLRQEGQDEVMLLLFSRRLGRDLSQDESLRIKERMGSLGAERLSTLLFDLSPLELTRWLDDPEAR